MAAWTETFATATKYDLTDATLNPKAYPQSTPRQGGFTLQNRIDFDAVTAPTGTKGVANVLKLIHIPPRTIVNRVIFANPVGGAVLDHKFTDASGVALSGSSVGKSTNLAIGYIYYKTAAAYAASSATSQVLDSDDVALLPLTKKTGVVTTKTYVPQRTASDENLGVIDMAGTAGGIVYPHILPYGGWLVAQLSTGASVASSYAVLTGDLHIIVGCDVMPE